MAFCASADQPENVGGDSADASVALITMRRSEAEIQGLARIASVGFVLPQIVARQAELWIGETVAAPTKGGRADPVRAGCE